MRINDYGDFIRDKILIMAKKVMEHHEKLMEMSDSELNDDEIVRKPETSARSYCDTTRFTDSDILTLIDCVKIVESYGIKKALMLYDWMKLGYMNDRFIVDECMIQLGYSIVLNGVYDYFGFIKFYLDGDPNNYTYHDDRMEGQTLYATDFIRGHCK